MKHLGKRILSLVVAMALVAGCLTLYTPKKVMAATDKLVVSLGDSYASGEGLEPFYGQDKDSAEKVKDEAWLAHRSTLAWSGKLKVNGKKLSEQLGTNWFFEAASGAETEHLTGTFTKSYNYDGNTGSYDLPAQLDVFKKLPDGRKADYVTVSIGGNDIGFTSIMSAAVQGTEEELAAIFKNLEDEFDNSSKDAIRNKIKNSYKAIAEAAGDQAQIIVVGYPYLMNPEGFTVLFYKVDAAKVALVNNGVDWLNSKLEALVNECSSEGMKICFVPVAEEFKGHEAYTEDAYINSVIAGAQAQDLDQKGLISSYSLHPNAKGTDAFAKVVQGVIDKFEAASSDTVTSTDTIKIKKATKKTAKLVTYKSVNKEVVIPDEAQLKGKTYQITAISKGAVSGNAKIETLTFGRNVTELAANIVKGDKKLMTINIKGKLTKVAKNAFKGLSKKAVINVYATEEDFAAVEKLIKASGVNKKVKIVRVDP